MSQAALDPVEESAPQPCTLGGPLSASCISTPDRGSGTVPQSSSMTSELPSAASGHPGDSTLLEPKTPSAWAGIRERHHAPQASLASTLDRGASRTPAPITRQKNMAIAQAEQQLFGRRPRQSHPKRSGTTEATAGRRSSTNSSTRSHARPSAVRSTKASPAVRSDNTAVTSRGTQPSHVVSELSLSQLPVTEVLTTAGHSPHSCRSNDSDAGRAGLRGEAPLGGLAPIARGTRSARQRNNASVVFRHGSSDAAMGYGTEMDNDDGWRGVHRQGSQSRMSSRRTSVASEGGLVWAPSPPPEVHQARLSLQSGGLGLEAGVPAAVDKPPVWTRPGDTDAARRLSGNHGSHSSRSTAGSGSSGHVSPGSERRAVRGQRPSPPSPRTARSRAVRVTSTGPADITAQAHARNMSEAGTPRDAAARVGVREGGGLCRSPAPPSPPRPPSLACSVNEVLLKYSGAWGGGGYGAGACESLPPTQWATSVRSGGREPSQGWAPHAGSGGVSVAATTSPQKQLRRQASQRLQATVRERFTPLVEGGTASFGPRTRRSPRGPSLQPPPVRAETMVAIVAAPRVASVSRAPAIGQASSVSRTPAVARVPAAPRATVTTRAAAVSYSPLQTLLSVGNGGGTVRQRPHPSPPRVPRAPRKPPSQYEQMLAAVYGVRRGGASRERGKVSRVPRQQQRVAKRGGPKTATRPGGIHGACDGAPRALAVEADPYEHILTRHGFWGEGALRF